MKHGKSHRNKKTCSGAIMYRAGSGVCTRSLREKVLRKSSLERARHWLSVAGELFSRRIRRRRKSCELRARRPRNNQKSCKAEFPNEMKTKVGFYFREHRRRRPLSCHEDHQNSLPAFTTFLRPSSLGSHVSRTRVVSQNSCDSSSVTSAAAAVERSRMSSAAHFSRMLNTKLR